MLLTLWISCQFALHARPNQDQINGQKETVRGGRAFLSWQFDEADYVNVVGDTTHYPRVFQIFVTPQQTTTYTVRAHRSNDSSELTWTIRVYEPDLPKVPQRGGDVQGYSLAPRSNSENSPYYVGYQQNGSLNSIANMKILQVEYPDSTHHVLALRTVFLDQYGNQLSMLPADQLALSLRSQCNALTTEYQPIVLEEKWIRSDIRMMMTICIDRSSTSEDVDVPVRKAVSDYPFYMGTGDKLSVISFNQEPRIVCSHMTKDKLNNLGELFVGEAQGLNASMRCTYTALQRLEAREKTRNIVVLISTGADNSSFIYTAEDIIQKAKLRQTRVFTIGIGDLVDSYPLRYIASQTGGRYYALSNEKAPEITNILREITYSIHGAYVLQIPMQSNVLRACDSAAITLRLKTRDTTFLEQFSWSATSESTQPRYQALSMFGFRQTEVMDEYLPLLKSVAQVLKDNPKKVIEISGHSSAEGDEDAMRQLALDRIQSVRRRLVELGVNSSQLRGKAVGDLKPIYYFQQSDWQKKFNRRVEVRWLDPSILPYELVAEYCYTENEAMKYTEQWEKRGYRAYYERVLVKGMPACRVKLWGYATEVKANEDAAAIKKKYSQKLDIE